jgi:hypothetical protein
MRKVKNGKWLMGFIVVGLSLGIANMFNHQGVTQAEDSGESINPIPQEVISRRTEYSKTYDNGDGTFTTKISLAPLHYLHNGQWKETKTKIEPTSVIKNNTDLYEYASEENVLKSYFKNNSSSGNLLRIEVDNHYLSWQPQRMYYIDSEGNQEELATANNVEGLLDQNSITYQNIFPNIDQKFTVLSGKLKDNIILHKPPDLLSLTGSIEFAIEGLIEVSNGSSFFFNGKEQIGDFSTNSAIEVRDSSGDTIMFLEAPFVYEKDNEQERIEIIYQARNVDGNIYLAIKTSADWLLDPERVYPVTIDPTITLKPPTDDTDIRSGSPDTNHGDWDGSLGIGYDNASNLKMRTLIKFNDLSSIPCCSRSSINSAKLYFYAVSYSSTSINIYLREILSSWTEGSATWNNMASNIDMINYQDIKNVSSGTNGWMFLSVTDMFGDWKFGSTNYGAAITGPESGTQDYITVKPKEFGTGEYACYLEVNYSYQCTPNSTCCDSNGCYRSSGYICSTANSCSGDDVCSDWACDGSGNCNVQVNCSDCGDQDCDYLNYYFCSGTQSPTGTDYVKYRDYQDCNRPCSGGACQSCSCSSYSDSTVDTCGTCEYCTSGDSTCSYYGTSSVCSTADSCNDDDLCSNWYCNGSGSCSIQGDCTDCGTQDCDYLNYYFDEGADSATGTNYCKYRDYVDCNKPCSSNLCQSCSCTSYSDSTVATCGICKYCDGSTCSNYPAGSSCGTDEECDGNGNCGDICECISGDCCDGCNYRPSSYKCQEDVKTEYGCPWGASPGDDVGVRHQDRYCSGSSASCDGELQWDSWTLNDDCISDEKCEEGEPTCVPITEENGDEENGGCSCSSIGSNQPVSANNIIGWLFPFLLIGSVLLVKSRTLKRSNKEKGKGGKGGRW